MAWRRGDKWEKHGKSDGLAANGVNRLVTFRDVALVNKLNDQETVSGQSTFSEIRPHHSIRASATVAWGGAGCDPP